VTNRGCGLKSLLVGGLVLGLAVVAVQPAAAQSTIFNIPTTDTVAPKKGYFEFDYLAQLPKPDSGQFQIFMPRLVVGAGSMAEVGVNFANTTYADDGGTFSQIQPNFKVKFFNNDKAGVAAAAGVIGYFGVNHDQDNFGMVYAEISKKVKTGNYGPRFHAGIYQSMSYGDDEQTGAILGYEQPLSGKVSFVADWFSGKNFWGYFTPGISIVLPHSGLLNIGYALGNDSYDSANSDYKNRAFFIYYGITFP